MRVRAAGREGQRGVAQPALRALVMLVGHLHVRRPGRRVAAARGLSLPPTWPDPDDDLGTAPHNLLICPCLPGFS